MSIASPGKLNERITIYNKAKGKTAFGTTVSNMAVGDLVISCYAMLKTKFLNEIQSSIGTVLEDTITFVIRHSVGKMIKNDMIIDYEGTKYEIKKMNPDTQFKQYDVIIAKEIS